MGIRGELFTLRVESRNEARTYFFNVKQNRRGDRFISIVENIQRAANEAVRHQIMLYKEDADDFLDGLRKAIDALMDSD